ncbi:hypothetical protein GCM10011491_46980 [Brucella endophytica]|uniref:DUF3396 domain-containing protein n=1 Tax=Brucella endophytica TaxID=1963359 RepID=A0A916WN32_9HYPH|nr:type VI immunity family protein [Brucella endophytica]GGB13980.1 hypothetical protein GCM10011491_46980 [Brucella endophytica]
MWYEDALFQPQASEQPDREAVSSFASPAFRLAILTSIDTGHPFKHLDAYSKLFDIFKPILQRDAERLLMIETAGGNPRRRKSIKAEDWKPFEHLAAKVPADDGFFIGFHYQSGTVDLKLQHIDIDNVFDKGPTSFLFSVTGCVQLDATIPVADWQSGALDLGKLLSALKDLPITTGIAGFGLSISEENGTWAEATHNLLPVAEKFPVLDISRNRYRAWSGYDENKPGLYWLAGINWLTFVGEPLLTELGGADAISSGLPDAITVTKTPNWVLFQLGDRPITGEAGVDDDLLPLYHTLGAKLKPTHGSPELRRASVFGNNTDKSNDWERRFYDGKWFGK